VATERDEQTIVVSNEFATVRIRKIHTRNGERLEIESPGRGYRVRLDALQLEGLTWQPPETFSYFLRASLGPDHVGIAADDAERRSK
jgi:hypothetical protein